MMGEMVIVREVAERVLAVETPRGTADRYLIDRANRILRHCGNISQMPEVRQFHIDQFCLQIAALMRDSGFARFACPEDKIARMVLADFTDEDMRDFSTQVVRECLEGILNPRQLDRVCAIIIESGKRDSPLVEAMILADARNLDDLGAVGIFNELRRHLIHGKGVTEALGSWKRKLQYDYWSARIQEGFRFDSVRKIARMRLKAAEQFMMQLETENIDSDLEEFLLSTTNSPPPQSSRKIVEYSAKMTNRIKMKN